jgi:hypothetical protein
LGSLYDHFMSRRIFNLIMNKKFKRAPKPATWKVGMAPV